ncbi:hypothetical protein RUM43_013931 [Polyplax serrata]|uniref:tRNA (34-2'-O)-methyltransferase regulator WDR6 n=1 Tax=Polyplax serrata TaxID=468196 RepID=A0AAN8P0B7_POLSC
MDKSTVLTGTPLCETKSIHMDVLALSSYPPYILAGIGNYLYLLKGEMVHHSQLIFQNERIHKICRKDDLILLKGGKELAMGRLEENTGGNLKCHCLSKMQCADWIQDAVILNDALVGLTTAHNMFKLWDLNAGLCTDIGGCEEKCVLYSCRIVANSIQNVTVFAGTVFGEVLVWVPHLETEMCIVQRFQAHSGAIFSIEVNNKQNLLATTSDDRSLRLWYVNAKKFLQHSEEWKESDIQLIHILYGHTARVWKCLILPNYCITIGEDSQLMIWRNNGTLFKKITLHQESGIRSICVFEEDKIITGGEDGGITLIPLTFLTAQNKLNVNGTILKSEKKFSTKVCFTRNGFVYSTNGGCILVSDCSEEFIYRSDKFENYCILEVSSSGEYIALGSITGNIVILNILNKIVIVEGKYLEGRIYSIHWLDNMLLTCAPNGCLKLWKFSPGLDALKTFTLPICKERWTTCALFHDNKLIIGDRMGNIHIYEMNGTDVPIQSFKKIHSYLGVTDIVHDNCCILTIGRDGTLKSFSESVALLSTYKVPMDWPWKIINYKNDKLILGFLGISFVVWSLKYREVIASQECGGGHRSCDYILKGDKLNFLFVKDKRVFVVELVLNAITRIRSGFHGKETNSLKLIQTEPPIVVSGSEDTTIRLGRIANSEIEVLQVLKTHLSSIRALAISHYDDSNLLIVSVGGKAQFVIWKYNTTLGKCQELINHRLKNSEDCLKGKKPSDEPEVRFMCVDIMKESNGFLIATGCSDCQVQIFNLHQSGINCFVFEKVQCEKYILVTGGDDNTICASAVQFSESNIELNTLWTSSKAHACQVTGITILDNILISTSIDQRVTLWRWSYINNKLNVEYENQRTTVVPDVQGLEAKRNSDNEIILIIYGKGIEVLRIKQ